MRRSSFLSLAAAALGLAAAAGASSTLSIQSVDASGPGLQPETINRMAEQATKPGSSEQRRTDMRALLGSGLGSWGGRQRRARPGWTNRHVQRMAVKRRNKARHRKASRG